MRPKVTLSCYQFSGAKASAPAAFRPPSLTPSLSLCPPHTACLSFPPERGSYCGDVSCLKGTQNKEAFHPSAISPLHPSLSHLSLSPPDSLYHAIPSFVCDPPPPRPLHPTAATPPTPLFLFSHLCFGVCGGITAPGEHARQEQVEVVTEMMVVALQKY